MENVIILRPGRPLAPAPQGTPVAADRYGLPGQHDERSGPPGPVWTASRSKAFGPRPRMRATRPRWATRMNPAGWRRGAVAGWRRTSSYAAVGSEPSPGDVSGHPLRPPAHARGIRGERRTTLECARASPWGENTALQRLKIASDRYRNALTTARAEEIIGNACRQYDPDRPGEASTRQATEIVEALLVSRAPFLLLECPVSFTGKAAWKDDLRPRLQRARCAAKNAALQAMDAGVSTGGRQILVIAVRYGWAPLGRSKPRNRSSGRAATAADASEALSRRAPGEGRQLLLRRL